MPPNSLPDFHSLITPADTPSARLVRALALKGEATAAELVAETRLSRSAVSTALGDLRNAKVVLDIDTRQAGMGRPTLLHGLHPGLGVCGGVLLGLDEIRLSLCDVTHSVLTDESVPMRRDYAPQDAANTVHATLQRHCAALGIAVEALIGVGLAVSAPVSPEGVVLSGSILPTWNGVALGPLFASVLGCPVHAENESNCGAFAEMMWGAAKGESDFVLVKLDLGIGGAIVENGRLLTGARGAAAEFGHLTMDPRGALCRCGNRGCLETIAGASALLRQAETVTGRPVELAEFVQEARRGHPGFRRLLDDAADMAGWGIGLIGTVLNPPLFVISGGLAQAGEPFVAKLRDSYLRHTVRLNNEAEATRFVIGRYLSNDTVLGGVSLVLRQERRVG